MMRIPVPLIPAHSGIIDYVVPLGVTIYEPNGTVYARTGDHIHGIRDKAGTSLSVYSDDCPVCADIELKAMEALNQVLPQKRKGKRHA